MSKQIEERVVSIQFDNSRFERNVSQSMSTLDKLKQKLNLSGASKGLESVRTAAGKVNMSGLASSVDTVSSRFSALEVIGVTALANITNSAVNAGKRMISALTIDPIMDGFNEYEMTLKAVQTTMAGTGKTAEEVEKELKKLDDYADKTVYSSADMFNNLPKFTNAGVELETATKAMIGIANATALAGGGAQQASIAFYNLGQSIGTGYLTRMDYNSINNAGMATMEWKNAMVEAAIAQGTLTKAGEDAYIAGGKTYTLQQLFIDGLQQQWATADVLVDVFSDYGDETTEIGKKAWSAAQDVKTFTMMMESLKATAGTGWKDTWQIIFGDLEGAKKFWTGINDAISGVITKMADWRNTLLGGALNLGGIWDTITGKIENSPIGTIAKVADNVKSAAKDLEYFQDIVTKVWRGDYNNHGDNPDRYDLLEKAGYDHRVVQDLVNKGYQYKLTIEDVEESHKKFGLTMDKTSEQTKETAKSVTILTDEQLKNAGLTDEEISLYKALQKEADKLGISIDELVKNMSEKDGRSLLIDSFKNVWSGISGIFKAIGKAWKEIFNPGGVGELSVKLYGLITSLNNFTKKLRMTDETSDKLKRTFKGLFAILDIIMTVIGGPIKIAFKILTKILGAFNLNILDLTAIIGDAIVKFRNWIDRTLDFSGVCKKLAPYLSKIATAIKEWFAGMKDSKVIKVVSEYTKSAAKSIKEWFAALKDKGVLTTFISYAKKAGAVMKEWFAALKETRLFKLLSGYLKSSSEAIAKWFSGLKEADNIPLYIIQGLVNGLRSGIKMVASIIKELAITILDTIKSILGIHSPSTAFYDIGKNVILGLFNGIKDFITMIYDLIMSIGGKVIEIVKEFDVGSVITAFIGSGLTLGFIKIASAVGALTEPLEGVGDILKNTAKVVKSFSKVLGSVGNWINAQALKTVAISIAILVGSVALLCLLPTGKVWASIGAIAALALVLGALTFAIGKWGPSDGVQFGKMAGLLLSLAASVLILAIALKAISSIKPEAMAQTLDALWNVTTMLILILASYELIAKKSPAVAGAGKMLLKMAAVMAIMAIVVGLLGKMKKETIIKGMAAIVTLVGVMALMMLITKIGNFKKVGTMLMQIAGVMAIMAIVVGLLGKMKKETLIKGMAAIVTLVGVMALMMLITKIANFKKVGTMLMQIAGAMAIMAIVVGLLGKMKMETLIQGGIAVLAFVGIIALMMAVVKKYGKDAPKIAGTILAISVAIALMAGVAVLLGMVSLTNLAKGVAAVVILTALAAGLVYMTKFAGNDCYKSMIGIAIAIGVMAAAVAVLSFIEPGKLAVATLAMSLLIGMFALLVKATGKANGSVAVLVVMTIAIGMIGIILILLAKMPVGNALGAAIALSLLMLAMTGVLLIISKLNISIGSALKGIIGLLALCVPLLAMVGILYLMNGVNNAIVNAKALILLATALTLLLIPLCLVGIIYAATGGMAALGLVGLLGMCVPLLAIAGILCMMKNVNNAMVNAMALTLLIATMGDVCFKLALVGPLALLGVAALTALTTLILAVGVFAVGIGALMQKLPVLQSFLDTGISVLIKLAGGIGEMIGAFVSGIFTQIADSLPAIGLCLSQFMGNAMVFIAGAKLVDEKVLAGVGILTAAILALTVADVINGVASFLSGGSSFADLGTQLSQFMTNALPFIVGARLIKPEAMNGVKTLAETLLILTAGNLLDSLTSWFTGGNGIEAFTQSLPMLGSALVEFSDSVSGINAENVTAAANAAKSLAEMTKAVPNEGGIQRWFNGESGLAKFANNLKPLGEGLKNFSDSAAGITVEQVSGAVEAAKKIAEMTKAVPNEGGIQRWFNGESGLAKFANNLKPLGEGLKSFSDSAAGINAESVTAAVNAAKEIAEMTKAVPNEGGIQRWFSGESGLAKFAGNLKPLGEGLKSFSDSASGITVEQVSGAVEAAKKLADLSNTVPKEGGWSSWFSGESGLAKFSGEIPKLGEAILKFSNSVSGIIPGNVSSAVRAAQNLAELTKTAPGDTSKLVSFGDNIKKFGSRLQKYFAIISEIDISLVNTSKTLIDAVVTIGAGVNADQITAVAKAIGMWITTLRDGSKIKEGSMSGFISAINELGTVTVDSLIDTFDSGNAKMISSGKKLIVKFIDGLRKHNSELTATGKALVSTVCTSINNQYNKLVKAGKYLGAGLVEGIQAKETAVRRAAYKLGQKAVQGEKDGQESASPSKATIKAGKWLGEGLAIGIQRIGKTVYNSAYGLGETATGTISKAVSNISNIVNSDIDAQPTIRPVLDLSAVRAGAGSMNALFSGRTLSVDMAGVGEISASMAGFQNGGDSKEIVSGIKALRKDIAGMPRNTYNINGITYDDGTNVSDAVGSLVRAIKIERRS